MEALTAFLVSLVAISELFFGISRYSWPQFLMKFPGTFVLFNFVSNRRYIVCVCVARRLVIITTCVRSSKFGMLFTTTFVAPLVLLSSPAMVYDCEFMQRCSASRYVLPVVTFHYNLACFIQSRHIFSY